jgi:colanic acid biosynthesis glycosyl transferase WcaI
MRVLILHMRYAPDATGTGPLVTDLAQDLAGKGHAVCVVTSAPHYGRTAIAEGYRGGWLNRRRESGVDVWRTWSPAPPPGSLVGRAVDYSVYFLLSTLAGWLSGKADVILCVAPPISVAVSGWLVSRLRRTPFIFNVQDIWPDGLIEMGRLRNRAAIAVFRWLERFSYRAADRVSVVSEGMGRALLERGVPGTKLAVIPNWVDLDSFPGVDRGQSLAAELGLADKFVVLFAGNLGYAACLETIVGAAERLADQPHIAFLLVGEGSARAEAERRVAEAHLSNVTFLTTQPKERLAQVYASADVGLVTLRKGMGRVSVPSKGYAIMAAGRPILAAVPSDSEICRLVEAAGCGLAIDPEDPPALASAILDLSAKPEELRRWGEHALRHVAANFDRPRLTQRYERLLADVAEGREA